MPMDRKEIIYMIYTLTLNPALDRTIYVNRLEKNESIQVIKEEHYAGGKGIDVSRVITQFGREAIALGFLGGYAGKEIEGHLINEGVPTHFTYISEETRINVIVHCIITGDEIRFDFPGPRIMHTELAEIVRYCRNLKLKPTFVVISGSLPEGVNPIIYENLVLAFEEQGARVILDTHGEALKKGLLAGPFMIKPNRKELIEIVGTELTGMEDTISAARSLLKYCEIVTVSLGKEGILGVSKKEGPYLAVPPEVKVVNTVGAGDSAVAAMVLALENGQPLPDVLKYGAASGTASTLSSGTAIVNTKTFDFILPKIELREFKTGNSR